MNIGTNIRYLRKKSGMSQAELAEKLGYRSFTTIQKWESGVSTPPMNIFGRMAAIFGVDLDEFAHRDLSDPGYSRSGAVTSVPVYGRIPAGLPLEAVEDISSCIYIAEDTAVSGREYFSLSISGNSMHPKYEDGDIVIFERRNTCENGDDCAVRIGIGDAVFKKIKKLDNGIMLQPINPEYDPIQISGSDADEQIEILGVAREIRRKV